MAQIFRLFGEEKPEVQPKTRINLANAINEKRVTREELMIETLSKIFGIELAHVEQQQASYEPRTPLIAYNPNQGVGEQVSQRIKFYEAFI